jgi:hypothetical protein
MSTPARAVSPAIRRPKLPALTGVRIFAALHIYLFHLKQAHDAGVLTFPVIGRLPAPVANLLGRGYISTGFSFQLSGFLLAYAYLDSSGRLKTSAREFWRGRFLRLYPLYALSLLLLGLLDRGVVRDGRVLEDDRDPVVPAAVRGAVVARLDGRELDDPALLGERLEHGEVVLAEEPDELVGVPPAGPVVALDGESTIGVGYFLGRTGQSTERHAGRHQECRRRPKRHPTRSETWHRYISREDHLVRQARPVGNDAGRTPAIHPGRPDVRR